MFSSSGQEFVNIVLANCTFIGNSAASAGGGAAMRQTTQADRITARFYNCTFLGNAQTPSIADLPPAAPLGGGALANTWTLTELTNCMFSGNTAVTKGGAIANDTTSMFTSSRTKLFNSTLSRNNTFSGSGGGGVHNQGVLTVRNSILWGNAAPSNPEIADAAGSVTVTDSDVQGGWGGDGNIQLNPFFHDDDGPDNIVGTIDDNLRVSGESPCINDGLTSWLVEASDLGDLDTDGTTNEQTPRDLDVKPRATPTSADTGAYEFQSFCRTGRSC